MANAAKAINPQASDGDTGAWKPWIALADVPPRATRSDLKPSLFLGSRYGSVGDAREIFQGDGHGNQLVAVAINGKIAERIERAVNSRDDLVVALKTALGHIGHMAAFFGGKGTGYSFEALGEDLPGMRAALAKAGSAE